MCDIYDATCPKCKRKIDMHLADFDTAQDEVMVMCCIPSEYKLLKKGVLWLVGDDDEPGRDYKLVLVVALTDNARRHADGNHPNAPWTQAICWFGDTKPAIKLMEEAQQARWKAQNQPNQIIPTPVPKIPLRLPPARPPARLPIKPKKKK